MNAYELADGLSKMYIETDNHNLFNKRIQNMLRQQADRIAELEKEVLMWENAEVPTEVMADLIQELERRKFITTPQIKELSDEEIKQIWYDLYPLSSSSYWDDKREGLAELKFARAILKKASEK